LSFDMVPALPLLRFCLRPLSNMLLLEIGDSEK
jgi:hypothetical protein